MPEKVGSDVLGKKRALPHRAIPEELRKRLEQLEEERKRKLEELGIRQEEKQKIRQLEEEGKLPKLPMLAELPHEKKLCEGETWEKISEEIEKSRSKPKKTKVKVTKTYET